jgi:hypothetical protein
MGRLRTGLLVLGAAHLALFVGCKHDTTLKPPKEDAVYRLPPDDPRYSTYVKYPDGTLNQFPKRDQSFVDDPNAAHQPCNRMTGMNSMGGGPGH